MAAQSLNVLTRDGRHLDVLVSGPETGTALVFHTGSPAGLVPLPAGVDPTPLGVRTILYARPGYGRSTPRPGRRVADSAADVAAVLDAVGAARFINVGWSGGGPHALACDALLPERCLGTAIIASIAPYLEAEPSSQVRAWFESDEDNRLALAGDLDGFRAAVAGFLSQLAGARGERILADAKNPAEREFLAKGNAEWVASFISAAGASGSDGAVDDFIGSLREWGFPLARVRRVSVWHGTEDENVPPFHAEWLRDHLPAAELRLQQGEGHASIVAHLPEIIAELLAGPGQA